MLSARDGSRSEAIPPTDETAMSDKLRVRDKLTMSDNLTMSDEAAPKSLRGDLRRADKAMTSDEVANFLTAAFCGRTGTVGSDGYPYVVPNLFVWMDGRIYLHTAKHRGHFLNNVEGCDRVCFEVDAPGQTFPYGPVECDTSVSYTSVIVFGRIAIITDDNVKQRFYEAFMDKYAPKDSWGRTKGTFPRMGFTVVYAIDVETMSGNRSPLPAIDKQWHASAIVQR
jgi:nitroimidazol reductase NimA-like FMN-containing flavoprotein (pyridoxamine 5'-phosphate oxidase superfamily)